MESVTLNSGLRSDALVIPGAVADRMINDANEAQLKIYLYLLKQGPSADVTVSSIADYFNYTESDVKRALRFLNGISSAEVKNDCEEDADRRGNVQGDNIVTFSVRPSYSREKLAEFAGIPEISQLLCVAEQYMARPLKSDDIASMLYMYDSMGFSAELIEFLIEYCIGNNKKSMRSIEAVAAEWKEAGINSAAEAKNMTRRIPKEMPEVLAAFGLGKGRAPVDAEIAYVRKWTESYGYGMDIIAQACQRTILTINKPDFRYANTILKRWYDAKVKTVADIIEADEKYRMQKAETIAVGNGAAKNQGTVRLAKSTAKSSPNSSAGAGKFRNFSEREYDYDSLMDDILSN